MKRFCLALLLVALPGAAHAFDLALDLDGGWVQNSKASDTAGYGGALRLGSDVGMPGARLAIEIGGGLRSFSGHPAGLSTLYSAFGGARLGVGEFIRPGLYAHLGYGSNSGGGGGSGAWGEAGIFVDLGIPIVSLGVHAAYQSFISGNFQEASGALLHPVRPQILVAGIHGTLSL